MLGGSGLRRLGSSGRGVRARVGERGGEEIPLGAGAQGCVLLLGSPKAEGGVGCGRLGGGSFELADLGRAGPSPASSDG